MWMLAAGVAAVLDARAHDCGPWWSTAVVTVQRLLTVLESPVHKGVLRPSSVGGRCLGGPMSTTIGERFEVGDLDAAAVLEAARENEREIRRREFLKLRLAAHWADLHPATADTGVETSGWSRPRCAGRRRVAGR
jgi:hypothetical protein